MMTKFLTTAHIVVLLALSCDSDTAGAEQDLSRPRCEVGPATEQRFPSLKVRKGFRATLFACDPLIEYPSVIALGPRPGTLFVAHDYVTGLGVEITRRDEIRLISDTDGDGYADQSTVFAKGFNSIQGLAFDDGEVFAMHAPLLTRLRDTNGDGVADDRRDLLNGLGLPPEENDNRLHCANGVVVGHDGWLYLALGDRGCDVRRPEGDRLVFRQGGILRCRPDGRDLHVFAMGLRNIYDIALDEELNVFVRDNENDGGDYMIRVCHCFFGSDHGYPYHYYERPDEAMKPLADLGRGSSAGGVCYLETAFPPEFRGDLFFCEWGRSVVRYPRERMASSFAPMKEGDFAYGDSEDAYGFKPTDLVVDRDGSLLIADWADGQRPRRGRGRIFRIEYIGGAPEKRVARPTEDSLSESIAALNSPSYYVRREAQRAIERHGEEGWQTLREAIGQKSIEVAGRLHAVWVLARTRQAHAIEDLFHLAQTDRDPRVRAQAIRAIADLTDPVLTEHRLAAKAGDTKIAERLAELVVQRDPRVTLEVVIALGRLRWADAAKWLHRHHSEERTDDAVMHAAMQTIRRTQSWSDTFAILDDPSSPMRRAALWAIAEQYDTEVVDALLDRLQRSDATCRREYADLLSRVYKKPKPWEYWGFRPAPRPVNAVAWERTREIERGLVRLLDDPDRDLRALVLRRMLREAVTIPLPALAKWLEDEANPERVRLILGALGDRPGEESADLLETIVQSHSHANEIRSSALTMIVELEGSDRLLAIGKSIEDGPVLAEVLRQLGRRPTQDVDDLLLAKLESKDKEVCASAIRALVMRKSSALAKRIPALLADDDVRVRCAGANAAGALNLIEAADTLLVLASDPDLSTRRACMQSLAILNVSGAADSAIAALEHPGTQLAALAYLKGHGHPQHQTSLLKLARRSRSHEVLGAVVRALSHWADEQSEPARRDELLQTIARIAGDSGAPLRWVAPAPMTVDKKDSASKAIASRPSAKSLLERRDLPIRFAQGTNGRVSLLARDNDENAVWLAASQVFVEQEIDVEFLASSSGTLHVWVNSELEFQRAEVTSYRPDQDRFSATLSTGANHLLVRVDAVQEEPLFQLRFRRKSSQAELEQLISLLLASRGDTDRGREIFMKAEKSQCVKCHRLGDQGGRIGPDLTGVGSRFSRIHLIESILQPSRTIAPSYSTYSLALTNGRVISGVKIAEDQRSITVGDALGKIHEISRSDIDESSRQTKSTMPDGLEKQLNDRELMDLLAFLLSMSKPD